MTKPPVIPSTLVELGRAVELECGEYRWRWSKKDDFILCSSESGTKLFIFARPKSVVERGTFDPDKAKSLYQTFNRREDDQYLAGRIPTPRRSIGRAKSVVYSSDKFGRRYEYIHHFKSPPILWVDNAKTPRIVALTGGKIRVTQRGIEG